MKLAWPPRDRGHVGARRLHRVVQRVELVGHQVERRHASVGPGVRVEDEHEVGASPHLELGDAVGRMQLVDRPQPEVAVERERPGDVVGGEGHVTDPEGGTVVLDANWRAVVHAVQCVR